MTGGKSKVLAGILAILFGGLGIHKFYLGKVGWGIVYILFCWTYIPSLLGLIEGIIYLASSEENFDRKYGRGRAF
ncbi:TM2 domain-containing protein [Paenibacillus sp. RC67]|uniref:TM2 domain-containing protein n=1 Tax=Paenibacillus sp. RC67 TaxID=3039392 RepID=UPI0024AE7565|nr:TM2 domain-containing protein [Paenibacillus sp. RC67]